MTTNDDAKLKRAINSLYGGAIGDALGARYEFDMENLLEKDLKLYSDGNKNTNSNLNKELLPLLGEGVWALYPGQVTDDTEMAMALAYAIIHNKDVSVLDKDIANAYHNWYLSDPFDIGKSTKNALSKLDKLSGDDKLTFGKNLERDENPVDLAEQMRLAATGFNNKCLRDFKKPNLSNGMLMRIGPLAIFIAGTLNSIASKNYSNLSELMDNPNQGQNIYELIKAIVKLDTSLTHASLEALNYAVIYVTLIAFAVLDGTLLTGLSFLNKYGEKSVGDAWLRLKEGLNPKGKLAHDPTDMIGDVRIAFQLAIRKAMLVDKGLMNFENALISTIRLGGDTDTNAAIVGYLVGPLIKEKAVIPHKWKESLKNAVILSSNDDKECKLRVIKHNPNKYLANIENLANSLFKNFP